MLSPALGGIVIGQRWAAPSACARSSPSGRTADCTLRRGFTLDPADRVLVVEDVVTTGGSTRETIDVARAAGATVVGAASIVDRSGGDGGPRRAVPRAAADVAADVRSGRVPALRAGVPVVKPGSTELTLVSAEVLKCGVTGAATARTSQRRTLTRLGT